jgi:preprotein translocase subunit Sss1
VAIVWSAEKLGRALAVVVGVLSLGVLGFVIRLRYRDDDL